MSNKQQTAVKLIIAEIQRRVAIIQSEPQTMARELMIENLDVDLDRYEETEKEQHSITWENTKSAMEVHKWESFQQYYNETYGGGEQ